MANTEKMTKRKWYEVLTAIVDSSDYEDKEGAIAFINHEVELLNRKSGSHTQTARQRENVAVLEEIRNALREVGRPVTITELQNEVPTMAAYSNQRLSALLRSMGENGTQEVVKVTDKKKSYFSLTE